MASSDANENTTECKTCQCGEGEKDISNTTGSESSDKQPETCPNCQLKQSEAQTTSEIIKSGPLFVSSKGIGWTSWKKRWFVLTQTSLMFYRVDPNSLPQKGGEANPALGGIDLNNSGSVVVKPDKKLLTVFFPDGRDGRTFTLKGETPDELQEWKTALENALAQAPSVGPAIGQSGILHTETADSVEASSEQGCDQPPSKSMVIGRPALFALEDVDGSPTFLEKALRFIEEYGIKVEGVLRQSADVEHVHRRVQEYEEGKDEFSPDEDAHVIGDCIKHVLREMPSSPIPASCCTALVEAYKTDRGNKSDALRDAIYETFPEPNLRLLQRCIKMMQIVAAHKSVNRMSLSAVAACMAPLLLRPLLAGECEFEDDFNMGGDGSLQLLKAAAAANHAQAILMIMLEDYDSVFDDGSYSSEIYTESEYDIEDDELTGSETLEDDGSHYEDNEDDLEHSSSGSQSGSSSYLESDISDSEEEDRSTVSSSSGDAQDVESNELPLGTLDVKTSLEDIGRKPQRSQSAGLQKKVSLRVKKSKSTASASNQASVCMGDVNTSATYIKKSVSDTSRGRNENFKDREADTSSSMKRPTRWGRTSAKKNVSTESIDYSSDDDIAIQRLETSKSDLEAKVTKEVTGNASLRENLNKRKEALRERRSALEKDVEGLREQLQKERDLRASLESGLMNFRPGHVSITPTMDTKTRADLEEINLAEADIINLKQKASDLRSQLSHFADPNYVPMCISCRRHLHEKEKGQEKNVNSTLLQKKENPSVSSSSVTSENVRRQKQDMPPSTNKETSQETTPQPSTNKETSQETTPQPSTNKETSQETTPQPSPEESSTVKSVSLPDKPIITDEVSSIKNNTVENISSAADNKDSKNMQSATSSPRNRARKHRKSKKNKDKLQDLEPGGTPSNKEPEAAVVNAAPDNFSLEGESPMPRTDQESCRSQTKDSLPSIEWKPSQKLPQIEEGTTDSKKSHSKGEKKKKSGKDKETEFFKAQNENLPSAADTQPSHKHLQQTSSDSATKKSISEAENLKSGALMETEQPKALDQNSPTLVDSQPSQKQLQQAKSQRTRFKDAPSAEDPSGLTVDPAPKKSSSKSEKKKKKKEPEDLQEQQSSDKGVEPIGTLEDSTTAERKSKPKKSSKSKDRKKQSENEPQNLEASNTSAPAPPAGTNSK